MYIYLTLLFFFVFSSPSRSPVMDTDIIVMNTMYKERFPKATQQMEERLKAFISETKVTEGDCELHLKDLPILRFVLHQIVEMARDCLQKSEEKLISSRYFYDMSENLERLLSEVGVTHRYMLHVFACNAGIYFAISIDCCLPDQRKEH